MPGHPTNISATSGPDQTAPEYATAPAHPDHPSQTAPATNEPEQPSPSVAQPYGSQLYFDACEPPPGHKPFQSAISRWFFAAVILAAMFMAFRLVEPFLMHIFFAVVCVVALGPLYEYLHLKLGWSPNMASAVTCLVLTVVIAIPMLLIAGVLTSQALDLAQAVSKLVLSGELQHRFQDSLGVLAPYLDRLNETLDMNISHNDVLKEAADLVRHLSNVLYNNITRLLTGVTSVLIGLALVLFVTFFLLIDGDKMAKHFLGLSPLPSHMNQRIQRDMLQNLRATLRGTVFLALLNGTLAGLGFWVSGLPNALFWGTVMTFASVVPIVGTSLVWLPAGIFLLASGDIWQAITVMSWSGISAVVCDNIIRPKLLGSASNLHPLLVFFAIMGGLGVFGMAGLLLGPMTVAFLVSLLQVYQRYFLAPSRQSDQESDSTDHINPLKEGD